MIVSSMTEQEIRHEMLNDMRSVPESKMEAFRKDFRSFVLRSSRFPVCKNYEYHTSKRNLLVVTLNALKRGKYDDPNIAFYCVYERPEGKYAARWAMPNRVYIFPPHFFDRYQERILKDDSLLRNEVIKRFVTNNHASCFLEINDEVEAVFKCFEGHYSDETIDIVSATSEGYSFGEVRGDVIVMKTIISDEMLSERQRQLFPALRERMVQATNMLYGDYK